MELIFNLKEKDTTMKLVGDVVAYELNIVPKGIDDIALVIQLTYYKVEKDGDLTKVIPLPDSKDSYGRISGCTSIEMKDGKVKVSFYLKGLYASSEDACAAEMEEIMTRRS